MKNIIENYSFDDDECINKTNICDTNAKCNNTDGSYTCTCNSGYYGNGTLFTGRFIWISIPINHKYLKKPFGNVSISK